MYEHMNQCQYQNLFFVRGTNSPWPLYFTEYKSHLCLSRTKVLNSIIISSATMNYLMHKLHPIFCQYNIYASKLQLISHKIWYIYVTQQSTHIHAYT